MHRTSLAPLLSATLSRVSCWITSSAPAASQRAAGPGSLRSLGPLQDLDDPPALLLRLRTGLLDADAVADVEVVALVVHEELGRALHRLAVQRVRLPLDHGHDGRAFHLVGRDQALAHLARIG